MTGGDIMCDLGVHNYGFVPAVISPFELFGNMINRFLYGVDTYPLRNFGLTRQHAQRAAEVAISSNVTQGILEQANILRREQH